MEALQKRLPSRNWCIFWGTTGTLGLALAYDKWQVSLERKRIDEQCLPHRSEPIPVWLEPRQTDIHTPPTHWARYWFTRHVSPVLDAAAIEYEVREPKVSSGGTRRRVRDLIWRGKEQLEARLERASELGSFFKDPADIARNLYDPSVSLVAIGGNAWREMIRGIAEGCFTDRVEYTNYLVAAEREKVTRELLERRKAEEAEKVKDQPSTNEKDTHDGPKTLLESDILNAEKKAQKIAEEVAKPVEKTPATTTTATASSTSAINPHMMMMAAASSAKAKQQQYLAEQQLASSEGIDTELQEILAKIDSKKLVETDPIIDPALYDMGKMPLNLQLPALGYIPASNLRGWTNFPARIIGFFNERKTTKLVGNETMKFIDNRLDEFRLNKDESMGSDALYEEDEWSDKQRKELEIPTVPWLLASRLFIYRPSSEQ